MRTFFKRRIRILFVDRFDSKTSTELEIFGASERLVFQLFKMFSLSDNNLQQNIILRVKLSHDYDFDSENDND